MAGTLPGDTIRVLDHGFVRLDDAMASDLSVVNAARVSFARRKEEMDESDVGLVGFLMRDRHGCYDDATEVLTATGWKAWPNVTGEELFATRSREGRLEYQPALRLVRKEFRGHMIGFKGMSIDLLVTPDHNVFASTLTTRDGRRRPSFRLDPAHSVLWKPHRHTTTASWGGERIERFHFDGTSFPAGPLLQLIGFFIGDGNLTASNHVEFNLRKEREISFLRRVALEAGLEVREWKNRHLALPVGSELRQYFARCYVDKEKVIPSFLLELAPDLLEDLFAGLLESDGSRLERPGRAERQSYHTTSKRLADSVQVLALKMGRSATVRPHAFSPGDGHYGSKPRWRVTIYNARNSQPALCRTREQADSHMGVERYDGCIHCVEVPNSTLYVRRNGYPVWSGNTPFEHNAFRFHIRCPLFVAREWFRHRIGCLTGDTVVTFIDTNGHATPKLAKTINELWTAWTEGEANGNAPDVSTREAAARLLAGGASQREVARTLEIGRRAVRRIAGGERIELRDARSRIRRMRLRVLNETTGEFTAGHVSEIVDKGVQPVYRLTLADGKQLTLTENHRVLTGGGWMKMGDAVGLEGAGAGAHMTRGCSLMTNGVVAYRSREWLREQRRLRRSVAEMATEAALEVDEMPTRRGVKLVAHAVPVVSLEYLGLRQTFDLCVDGPWHNFVANGVVVHNSFNEFSMRYAKATDEFYVPEAEDVRSQVGKPGAYSFEPVDAELAERTREELQAVYETAYATYERLVEAGVARELARAVIPVGAYTEFYWTVNARSVMNFVSLRAADTAQREIRRYADAVERLFAEKMPVTHAAFVANDRTAP